MKFDFCIIGDEDYISTPMSNVKAINTIGRIIRG